MVILCQLGFDLLSPTTSFFLSHLVEVEGLTSRWPSGLSRALVERATCEYELVVAAPAPSQMAHAVFAAVAERIFRCACIPDQCRWREL